MCLFNINALLFAMFVTSRTKNMLINEIKGYKPSISLVSQARILLVGPVGAGKSSFFNSISSVFHGYVTSQAISGSSGDGVTTQVLESFKKQRWDSQNSVPQLLILTKVDEACIYVEKDIQDVYRSPYIQEKVSDQLGIPVSCIFPVKNYTHETHLKDNCDILLLSTLQEILHFANSYFSNI
uniref:Interferon-induced protein 44-like n=1 Tax=Scleropages formosus TaxID=113540 RepID=A0A8C9SCL2_SCLFO